MSPDSRATLSFENEIRAWEIYRRFAKTVEPDTKFYRDGVGNGDEQKRRRILMGMFSLVEFRSQDAEVKRLFQLSVGQFSLQEIVRVCGVRMPHFYYEWAFEVLPISMKTFGPVALKNICESPDHRRTFNKLDMEKRNLLSVKKVMES